MSQQIFVNNCREKHTETYKCMPVAKILCISHALQFKFAQTDVITVLPGTFHKMI